MNFVKKLLDPSQRPAKILAEEAKQTVGLKMQNWGIRNSSMLAVSAASTKLMAKASLLTEPLLNTPADRFISTSTFLVGGIVVTAVSSAITARVLTDHKLNKVIKPSLRQGINKIVDLFREKEVDPKNIMAYHTDKSTSVAYEPTKNYSTRVESGRSVHKSKDKKKIKSMNM